MITKEEAIKRVKSEYPDVDFHIGFLCDKTYSFSGTKNGQLPMGYYCIDSETGEKCAGIDIRKAADAIKKGTFQV